MTIETWPTTLPPPMVERQSAFTSGLVSPEEALNPERCRRLPDSRDRVAFFFDAAQMATFRAWVEGDLSYGAGWFSADWLSSLGYASHYAQIVMPWAQEARGPYWLVSVSLEIIEV